MKTFKLTVDTTHFVYCVSGKAMIELRSFKIVNVDFFEYLCYTGHGWSAHFPEVNTATL